MTILAVSVRRISCESPSYIVLVAVMWTFPALSTLKMPLLSCRNLHKEVAWESLC